MSASNTPWYILGLAVLTAGLLTYSHQRLDTLNIITSKNLGDRSINGCPSTGVRLSIVNAPFGEAPFIANIVQFTQDHSNEDPLMDEQVFRDDCEEARWIEPISRGSVEAGLATADEDNDRVLLEWSLRHGAVLDVWFPKHEKTDYVITTAWLKEGPSTTVHASPPKGLIHGKWWHPSIFLFSNLYAATLLSMMALLAAVIAFATQAALRAARLTRAPKPGAQNQGGG